VTEFPASGPSIERVRAVAQTLTPRVIRTPSVPFSAGNHAIAVAWASRELGFDATVVMPRSANPARVAKVEQLGARIVYGASGWGRIDCRRSLGGQAVVSKLSRGWR